MRLFLAASILTLLNAIKPAVVDDTAYLFFARHLAQHPTDPYGWELFWYSQPCSAMNVLLPPVLPYWLAVGVSLFGENLLLLKLWLFPFAGLLVWSVDQLLKRFAPRQEPAVYFIVCSGFVLPLFSVMLDVPALSLGLASLACYLKAIERRQFRWSLASAVLLALALQTKYSMLTIPVTIVAANLFFGGWRHLPVVAVGSAVLFFGWEYWLFKMYGTSHFWLHVKDQSSGENWLDRRLELATPMLKFIGLLAGGWGLYAARVVGFPRWFTWLVASFGIVGTLAVLFTPGEQAILLKSSTGTTRFDLPMLVFGTLGAGLLLTLFLGVVRLLVRCRSWRLRVNANSTFLVSWLMLELLAHFVLTPFPAGRRVMGFCFVASLLACRLVSLARVRQFTQPDWFMKGFLLATGLGLYALDAWDAIPEKALVARAAKMVKPAPGGQYWTQGHWGWQFYTDLAGMKLVNPGVTHFQAGDVIVLPIEPDPYGFYRPYHSGAVIHLEADKVELLEELVWEDWLAGQTIPNLYGGYSPIVGRNHPRLRVQVYRVLQGWLSVRK